MKKMIIGSLVGAVLIFIWQFASWTFLDLHRPQQQYTPNQDTILTFLNNQLAADGGFFLPTTPQSASMDEMQAAMEKAKGKPWVQIFYHKEMKDSMVRNMIRNYLINVVSLLLFIWVVSKNPRNSFTSVLFSSVAVGLIVFFNSAYIQHIWYETFDLNAHLIDAVLSWGLVGLWLGWWLSRTNESR